MTQQTEAQRYADALDAMDDGYNATPRLAAAELRRLDAVNAQLLEALEDLMDTPFTGGPQGERAAAAIKAAEDQK